jgi:hypothetical protein
VNATQPTLCVLPAQQLGTQNLIPRDMYCTRSSHSEHPQTLLKSRLNPTIQVTPGHWHILANMLPASPRTLVQASVMQPALFSACYITMAVHAMFSESSSLQRYVPSSSDCPDPSGLALVIAASLQLPLYLASDTCCSVDATRPLSFTPRSCLLPQWLSFSFPSIPCSWHNCLAPAAHAS